MLCYNPGCYENLSPGQIAIARFYATTKFARCLTPSSYNNNVLVNPAYNYSVTQNETWSIPRYMRGNIIVKAGTTLSITCTVIMSKWADIIVEKTGQLVIDGGLITNLANTVWEGIQVAGDPALSHGLPSSTNPGGSVNKGVVRIKNGGTISHARIGIRDYCLPYHDPTGIILCSNANFINNVADVEFADPPIQYNNLSCFYDCKFVVNNSIGDGFIPGARIRLFGARGIQINGCSLEFKADSIYGNNGGIGIESVDARFQMNNSALGPSEIKNFRVGIEIINTNPLIAPKVFNTMFDGNRDYGVYLNGVYNAVLEANTFLIPPGAATSSFSPSGVYLDFCKHYKVYNNIFSEAGTMKLAVGVIARGSRDGSHEIYRNNFSQLRMGVNCIGNNNAAWNTNPGTSLTGLKINCNRFNLGTNNRYDVAMTYHASAFPPTVSRYQGETSQQPTAMSLVRNIYGATCVNNQNNNKWFAHQSCTITINHGSNTNSLTAVTQPSAGCASNPLNVVNQNIPLDFATHCPGAGPTWTLGQATVQQISVLTETISWARAAIANGEHAEHLLQSAVASKIFIMLNDSLENWNDSIIQIYDSNIGQMSDAHEMSVYTRIYTGDYQGARNRIEETMGDRHHLADALTRYVNILEQNNGVPVFTSESSISEDFEEAAADPESEAFLLARTLRKHCCDIPYEIPYGFPEEEEQGERPVRADDELVEENKERIFEEKYLIYPNPTHEYLNIELTPAIRYTGTLDLYDITGRCLAHQEIFPDTEKIIVSLENCAPGLYLIHLTDENGNRVHSEKIIRE